MQVAEKTLSPSDDRSIDSDFARSIYEQKYAWKDDKGTVVEDWKDTAHRVTTHVLGALDYTEGDPEFTAIRSLIEERKFIPGGRYLYASGRPLHQVNNCLLLKAEDSREGWADLLRKAAMSLQTGAGIGVDYSDVRERGAAIKRTGGVASGPLSLMQMVNEIGRGVMQGGSRRSAIWAGLKWSHPDCKDFIQMKDWTEKQRALKDEDQNFPLPMEFTNISVLLDDQFFLAYDDPHNENHDLAHEIYNLTMKRMLKTAEPGFSINVGADKDETLRNACTELTSADDSDICNLGSLNLANFDSIHEFREAVKLSSLFLLAGTVYSHVPYEEVRPVREKNRRLGLGVMGIHEWLLKRGKKYEPDSELKEWLREYATSTEAAAKWARQHDLSEPVKTRAIAPTGTIGIIGETTTGIEPIFCVAYKRRYLDNEIWKYQLVVDPTARRIIKETGCDPSEIEDAYTLANDVERRMIMQAWVQQFVDHGISSTINLPAPVTDEDEVEAYGRLFRRYLPSLRGVTIFPDGARGGQPLTPVPYEEAINHEGVVFEESEDRCTNGSCGI